jgi:lysosomal acid lipase/cholesteryl ester hydrolase
MGKYDVPANIHFILNKTGVDKLTYIGHSQGTMQFWIANILHDELGKHFEAMVGVAPIMYLGNIKSVIV